MKPAAPEVAVRRSSLPKFCGLCFDSIVPGDATRTLVAKGSGPCKGRLVPICDACAEGNLP